MVGRLGHSGRDGFGCLMTLNYRVFAIEIVLQLKAYREGSSDVAAKETAAASSFETMTSIRGLHGVNLGFHRIGGVRCIHALAWL